MAFNLKTDSELSKEEKYKLLISQIKSLTEGESNFTANISNITSAVRSSFESFLWTGFYFKDPEKENELVLGPFQGKVACTRIHFGKGVCGTAAQKKETQIAGNVDEFPGHIVCDPDSKSEIVVPVIKNGKTVAVLDIDGNMPYNFDDTDKYYLEKLIESILHLF